MTKSLHYEIMVQRRIGGEWRPWVIASTSPSHARDERRRLQDEHGHRGWTFRIEEVEIREHRRPLAEA